ncbi:hypothetical protein SAMN05421833_12992 [Microbispora rosea]|uniref:Uncharacterized protein n=1 Tax=Microbispora rosea TaxID=58117 RepID=A0A1N7GJA4_9ACTN|nr:hypothetical protein SAMN05421833_12992 [Microbispora rosea]
MSGHPLAVDLGIAVRVFTITRLRVRAVQFPHERDKVLFLFAASASAQIPGLLAETWQALVDELPIIGVNPHHRGVPHPGHPLFRKQAFGAAGLVSYVVDDAARAVHVCSIIWAG